MALQGEMTTDSGAKLNILARELGLAEVKDVLNYALALLEWATMEVKAGRIICSVDEKNKKMCEMHMKVLENLKEKVAKT